MNSFAGPGKQGKWPFENTKKWPLSHSPEISLVPIMFWVYAYSRVVVFFELAKFCTQNRNTRLKRSKW